MARRWDLFCRVIDNFGDVGVCWRLAADLAGRGETVRLWVDDASALRWMAPGALDGRVPGVQVGAFDAADEPGDVVVEAFGCDPPPAFVERMVERMSRQQPPPLWLNLEYLSAEPWVERAHALPSPQPSGLTKWFCFPGFTPATGGLLREPGLLDARAAFARPPGPRRASVFCYANPMLPALQRQFDGELWLCPGPAQALSGPGTRHLSWTDQAGYDRLLWSCELNVVRGEDSLVRAIWAGAPFLWQLYPQHDGAHRAKLEAFLDAFLDSAEPGFAADLRALWRAWNGFGRWPERWPDEAAWRTACVRWRERLSRQHDLTGWLQAFEPAAR